MTEPDYDYSIEQKELKEKVELNWYSNKVCYSCGYDLEIDRKKYNRGPWQEQTGCPDCCISFVE